MAKAKTEKSKSPEMEFILEQMRKNRSVSYGEIVEAAKGKGLKKIFPISFGRAQLTLGIVKKGKKKAKKAAAAAAATPSAATPVKRGPGRPRKNEAASAMPARRGPGRPRKVTTSSGDALGALTQIAEQMAALRKALSDIATIASGF